MRSGLVLIGALGLSACAPQWRDERPDTMSVRVGIGPDIYPLAYAPQGDNRALLGREVVVQARGVAAILGGWPEADPDEPRVAYRRTPLDLVPSSFIFGRNVAYVTDAASADAPLTHIKEGEGAWLSGVQVDVSGAVVQVERENPSSAIDPATPVVLGLYYADVVDYFAEGYPAWGQPLFAVRLGGVAGPPGRLTVGERTEDGRVELEVRGVLPSARVVVWKLGPEPTLVWASKRGEGFDPAMLIDTEPDDYTCEACLTPGLFALRRHVALPTEATLEVTYVAWNAPDLPSAVSWDGWAAYRALVDEGLMRAEVVEVSAPAAAG